MSTRADDLAPEDEADSLSLFGAVSLGTGVMIGAGIFALTGQVADLAGDRFPIAFVVAGVVVALSAYSYVKLSDAFPSSGVSPDSSARPMGWAPPPESSRCSCTSRW